MYKKRVGVPAIIQVFSPLVARNRTCRSICLIGKGLWDCFEFSTGAFILSRDGSETLEDHVVANSTSLKI